MKNVPIKFRGADIIADKLYYGDYITRSDGSCAIRFKASSDPFELFDLHEGEIAVKPESVAQLIGYDANGEEVYEGDTLRGDVQGYCAEFVARLGLDSEIFDVEDCVLKKGNDNERHTY